MKNKYESEMLQVIHDDMKDMHEAGIISDIRMCEYDKMCLVQKTGKTHKSISSAGTGRNDRISAKSASS